VKREVPVQLRRWWWIDASNGKTYIQLRYGNKPLDLAKGKPTIELKNVDELVSNFGENSQGGRRW
jgi:hypothetical protein